MVLTWRDLYAAGACRSELELFEQHFGGEVDVTPALCLSVADLFPWNWAARSLLTIPTWHEYVRLTQRARGRFDRLVDPLRLLYAANSLTWQQFDLARGPATSEYNRTAAPIFGRLYCEQPGSDLPPTRRCPDCPDGYIWTAAGPTDAECQTCKGLAYLSSPAPPSASRSP